MEPPLIRAEPGTVPRNSSASSTPSRRPAGKVVAGKAVHVILDNYATHKHPKVLTWLADHPRWALHFTPKSACWINVVESFGVFRKTISIEASNMTVPETTNFSMPSFLDRPAYFRIERPNGSFEPRYCGFDERETRLITEDRIALLREVTPKLTRQLLALEAQLTTTKWFDHRFIDSVTATKEFAAEYQIQYRRAWDINFDRKEAGKKRGLPMGDIFVIRGRELTSLWHARQKADEYGIPYDFFISHAMEACMRRGCSHLPRPNQLLDPRTIETVGLAWAEHVANRLYFSKLPQYRNEAFDDHPIQRAHHDWIVYLIKERHSKAGIIGQLCFIDKVLTVEQATLEFGEDKLSEAQERLIGEAEPYSDDIFLDLHPACFAVPHAYQPDREFCAACPKREACRTMEGEVRAAITYRHGSDDPVRDQKREATAARVRKHREKKRLAELEAKV